MRFNEERIAQGRQLANKLCNAVAARAAARRPRACAAAGAAGRRRRVEDAWILSRLQRAKADVVAARSTPSSCTAPRSALYDFVYGELCDWYLELVKPRLYAEDNDAARASCALHVLGETLALAHPVIPFVTEEIWSHVPGAEGC